jgi:Fic family protein
MAYKPDFVITASILNKLASISEIIGRFSLGNSLEKDTYLQREYRVGNIFSNCMAENMNVDYDDVQRVVEEPTLDPAFKVVNNNNLAYEEFMGLDPYSVSDLLHLHNTLMNGLSYDAGLFRRAAGGVYNGKRLIHSGTSPDYIQASVEQLMTWAKTTNLHPLIVSIIFQYQLQYIYPFTVGNGKVVRMWQLLLMYRWKPFLGYLPLEKFINERRDAYYASLEQSNLELDVAPFVDFMLDVIYDALYDVPEYTEPAASIPDDTDIFSFGDDDEEESGGYNAPADVNRPLEMSIQVEKLMNVIGDRTMTARQLLSELGLHHRQSFRKLYIQPAIEMGLIEMTVPDKPNSRNQRYRKVR